MCAGGAEEDTVGNDDGRPAAGLEQFDEERQEEQFCLLCFDDGQEVLGDILVVQAAGERRVGQDDVVLLLLFGMEVGQ